MPPAIPDRWLTYKACGKVIEGTRIICFKVPLSKHVQEDVNGVKEIWDIQTLVKTIPKLAGIIDLTNTTRYYRPYDIVSKGINYKKILMPGRMVPPEFKVTEFMDTVDQFLKKDDESLVGVHCTHGLNRTGYMVCRYLRDRLGFSAKDAIKDFQKARGYIMEREVYIADILSTMSIKLLKNNTVDLPTNSKSTEKELDSYDDDSKVRGQKKMHTKYSADESCNKRRKQNES